MTTLRDILEHFDEYERGTGRYQRLNEITEPSITWFERSPGRHIVNVAVTGLETISVHMESAIDAANRLVVAVGTAID